MLSKNIISQKLSKIYFYKFWQLEGILLSTLSFAQFLLLRHFLETSFDSSQAKQLFFSSIKIENDCSFNKFLGWIGLGLGQLISTQKLPIPNLKPVVSWVSLSWAWPIYLMTCSWFNEYHILDQLGTMSHLRWSYKLSA